MLKISLGCGMRKPEGYFGIDIRKFEGVDDVIDIGKQSLPFDNDCVDEIEADNLYEHLTSEQLFFSIDECYRVLKPTGFLFIKVPIFGTQAWLIHPDHKMHWNKDMVGFFLVPGNEEHKDPHGYLKGFWHVEFCEKTDYPDMPEEALWFKLYPNKEGGKYPYVKVS